MNTPQPMLSDPTGQSLLSNEVYISVIVTTKGVTKLRIRIPDAVAPYYEPKGTISSGLSLKPRYEPNNGVCYKLNNKEEITLPNEFAATKNTKRRTKARAQVMPDGTLAIPALTLIDRVPRKLKKPKTAFISTNNSAQLPNKAEATAAETMENRFVSAVKFINNNRKVVKAKLHLNASGDLLAKITKVMFVK